MSTHQRIRFNDVAANIVCVRHIITAASRAVCSQQSTQRLQVTATCSSERPQQSMATHRLSVTALEDVLVTCHDVAVRR